MRLVRSVSGLARAAILGPLSTAIAASVFTFARVDRAWAEEGAAGHYAPGAAASFVDALPGRPTLAVADYFMYYDGSASGRFPVAGLFTFDLHSKAYADSVIALYETPLNVLGGDYAVGLAVPIVRIEVEGEITGPSGAFRKSDSATGLGDVTLYPFMLGWKKGDLKTDVRLGVYAPTGSFEKLRLANLGKNYWTFEPMVSASWLSSRIGTEISGYAGYDLNTRNDATDYRSGDVFHVDATVAQHLPLAGIGVIGVGANGFYYRQVSGDSGSGARVLGDFKGRTSGVGPALSWIARIGKTDLAAEVKWLPELDVEHRLKGDLVWFKLGLAF
jgi:hypothetical protein